MGQSNSSLGVFQYSPLESVSNEIRLVTLLAGRFEDDIECRLTHHPLDKASTYEALSYSWGSSTKTITISTNGHEMHIRTNLYSALRHLRLQDRDRILWIDAICINQEDDTEKTHQVRMMKRIFESADQVVVWLGEATEHTELAFEKIKEIAEYGNKKLVSIPFQWARDELFGIGAWTALKTLLEAEWWTRTWVVQEVTAAKQVIVVCGKHNIPATSFDEGLRAIHLASTRGPLEYQLRIKLVQGRVDTTKDLLRLASKFRELNATDPRDKLYGLFGLASDMGFEPDYKASVREVYRRFVEACIKRSGTLDVLSFVKFSDSPTWIPNWLRYGSFTSNELILYESWENSRLYRASADSVAEFQTLFTVKDEASIRASFGIDEVVASRFCSISGFVTDTITHLCDPVTDTESVKSMKTPSMRQWISCFETYTGPSGPYQTKEELYGAFYRTLVADHDGSSMTSIIAERASPTFILTVVQMLAESNLLSDLDNTSYISIISCIIGAVAGRRFFISKNGYMGLAPSRAEVGDSVCILFGGQTPFILRKFPGVSAGSGALKAIQEVFGGDGNLYLLIGESYVHGIMDGEAYSDFKTGKSKVQSQTFVLG
jgi:hypothetical protein